MKNDEPLAGLMGANRWLPRTLVLAAVGAAAWAPFAAKPEKNDASVFFRTTNVWTAEFSFSPEEWAAMMPTNSGSFPGPGGPGRPGRPGGPGGPGGRGFGPGMFLAPAILQQADSNHDSKLSLDEFTKMSERWFTAWDKEKAGKLSQDALRDGLNSQFQPGPGGGPGRGPGGPSGPGGPGSRGGLWLQGKEGQRNGLAAAAGIEFKYVHADLNLGTNEFKDVAVRFKGNGTWMQSRGTDKHSLKVDLNDYTKGQKLGAMTKLNFHNCITDASYMNEVLSHRLFRDAGVPAPRTAFARVYVKDGGEKRYLGLYSMVEDVDHTFVKEWFGTGKGALLKPVTPNPFADLGTEWSKYNQTYDPKMKLSGKEKQRIIDFCHFVIHADDKVFAEKLGDYLDLDNFSRFMAVTVWLSTMDSILGPGQNYYVYLNPKTSKFSFIPWDLDHSFGQFGMMGSQEQRTGLSIEKPWMGANRFLERVFATESFKKLYHERLAEFSNTIFKPERFFQQVDELAAAIRPAVEAESETKLERFDAAVAGKSVEEPGFGGGPRGRRAGEVEERGFGPRGFGQPATPIKGFVTGRASSVIDQLSGKSQGEILQFGGPGGPGGRRGGMPGPGTFLAASFEASMDANKDGSISHEEFSKAFQKWFAKWNTDKSGALTEEQLRDGLNEMFRPRFPRGPGGFGGPDGPRPPE